MFGIDDAIAAGAGLIDGIVRRIWPGAARGRRVIGDAGGLQRLDALVAQAARHRSRSEHQAARGGMIWSAGDAAYSAPERIFTAGTMERF